MKLSGAKTISSFTKGFVAAILVFIIAISFTGPLTTMNINYWDRPSLIEGSAMSHVIETEIETFFSVYSPHLLSYDPEISPAQVHFYLSNADLQGLNLPTRVANCLVQYGFVLVDEGYESIYGIYADSNAPKFITTDLCLHASHVLYDLSLRALETSYFSSYFEIMLQNLRTQQQLLNDSVTVPSVKAALEKNIAYLSVMLYLLDNQTYPVPSSVGDYVTSELNNINSGNRAASSIFGYDEDYSQYKVRGHYTRSDILARYFQAMMYAGRMGFQFQLQDSLGGSEARLEQTRMAMLLASTFNTTAGPGSESIWDYWDRIYGPVSFYVGTSDDLTVLECYQIWKSHGSPAGDQLADDNLILEIIEEAKNYREPQINSVFVYDDHDIGNTTQGFRLFGQRFIPDSYILQQLVDDEVDNRMLPSGLDVFSVLGSSRAAYHLQGENETYSDYSEQVLKLREAFSNLTDTDWTQNLYWLWLYSLFPLLTPVTEGYPGFMLNDAWMDKSLLTALGSWTELRHDTILYAKQSYTREELGVDPNERNPNGYVEPYPGVYARLSSLVSMLQKGLENRGLGEFSSKFEQLIDVFDNLVDISIKELENEPLTDDDFNWINNAGELIASIASYKNPVNEPVVCETDNRTAVIVDIHTDPTGSVLEAATGNPFVIYVVVQDSQGNLRLTRGGTFSYYEFPSSCRLSDGEWHELLDSTPLPLLEWLINVL